MCIVLSQRVNQESPYQDTLFERYQFPKRYRGQICTGDSFIYHQGDRYTPSNRFYFGAGLVGAIYSDPETSDLYFADLINCTPFREPIPIRQPDGNYYESLGYENVLGRSKKPAWQNAIRRISREAFRAILSEAQLSHLDGILSEMGSIEADTNPLRVLQRFNHQYACATPLERVQLVGQYLDRGTAVPNALKRIIGHKCQVCGMQGFLERSGERYLEAHHITPLADKAEESQCSDNIILVCPTCHRKLHHAKARYASRDATMAVTISDNPTVYIPKNTMKHLRAVITRKSNPQLMA